MLVISMVTPRKLFPVVGIHLRSPPNVAVVPGPHAERDPHARGGTATETGRGTVTENGIEKSTGTEIVTDTKTGTETEIEADRVIVTARETGTSEIATVTEAVKGNGNEKMRKKEKR